MNYRYLLAFLPLLALGCASQWEVNTNLDPSKVEEYFKPSNVAVIEPADYSADNYKQLGAVSGESCQANMDLPPPKEASARLEARRAAADVGADTLVIDQCVSLSGETRPDDCVAAVICYGRALQQLR